MPENQPPIAQVGLVAIGRNEGDRLRKCIKSVMGRANKVVYVDSGSTDDSVAMAKSHGVVVVELDMARPFTAARARNEGFRYLCKEAPELNYVQFVDGDCEVVPGWLEKAVLFLNENKDAAVVCGRRRERFPSRSLYNMLCDMEWDTPVGEAKYCGGDAMMRANALERVGGYREDMIAGEEPELCVRFRAAGWKIWRLGEEMTLHDASMTRIGQWWKRNKRAGYAYAHGAHLHGTPPERYGVRQSRSAWVWGLGIPVVTIGLVILVSLWGVAILIIYPLQIVRLALRRRRSGNDIWWRALFLMLGKFPEMVGQINFLYNRLAGKTAHLIEYK